MLDLYISGNLMVEIFCQVTAAVENPSTTMDLEELIARFTKLSDDLGRLLNVSMVTFQQHDILSAFSLPDLSKGLGNATLYEMLTGLSDGVEQGELDGYVPANHLKPGLLFLLDQSRGTGSYEIIITHCFESSIQEPQWT